MTKRSPQTLPFLAPARPSAPRGSTSPRVRVFAYGSNLCADQMARRCPTARAIAVAVLPRHKLAFAGFSVGWQGAVADIVPHPDREVPGVVYEVSVPDLQALDRAEGVPMVYERTLRRVVDEAGVGLVVHVYRQRQPAEPGPPTEMYLRQILRGYQRHGIDLDRMLAAMETPRKARDGGRDAAHGRRRRLAQKKG
jgi:hypothetical protein